MNRHELGQRIRTARLKLNIGLREAARQLGVSAAYLSKVETDPSDGTPTEELLTKIARLVKVDIAELRDLAMLRTIDRKVGSKASRDIQAFYRVAKKHNLSTREAVQFFADAVSKQYPIKQK